LAWVLGKEGEVQEFSRSRRASVDRIKSLSVSLPSFAVQKRTVSKVFDLEQKIADAKQSLAKLDDKRKGILEKYL
jgi:restriction endonuclease S subunit